MKRPEHAETQNLFCCLTGASNFSRRSAAFRRDLGVTVFKPLQACNDTLLS